jgi:hypothetical protein
MNVSELTERIYKLIVMLREDYGMSYEEIEIFWKECIKKANENKD